MCVVQFTNNKFGVMLSNGIQVVFINKQNTKLKEVDTLEELLLCSYSHSCYPIVFDDSKIKEYIGGEHRWKSIKFHIAKKLNWTKSQMFYYIKHSTLDGHIERNID